MFGQCILISSLHGLVQHTLHLTARIAAHFLIRFKVRSRSNINRYGCCPIHFYLIFQCFASSSFRLYSCTGFHSHQTFHPFMVISFSGQYQISTTTYHLMLFQRCLITEFHGQLTGLVRRKPHHDYPIGQRGKQFTRKSNTVHNIPCRSHGTGNIQITVIILIALVPRNINQQAA